MFREVKGGIQQMEDAVKRTYVTRDDGNILIMSVVIVALLVATGLGYMRWSSDERWDSEFERATIQAYFVAQTGLIERGLVYLRTRQPTDLPQGTVFLEPGEVPNVGFHYRNRIDRVPGGGGSVFQHTDDYDVYSTGRVMFRGQQAHQLVPVERTATMRARLRSFANYMYLTDIENTIYNEIIWFWTPDTLYGRTHSNDFIGLKYSPTFYGPISTSQSQFLYYQPQNIYFAYPPVFNAPPVDFPKTARTLRAGGKHYSDKNGTMMTWIRMRGASGIDVLQYPLGSVPRDSVIDHMGPPGWAGIFVDGQVEIEGTLLGALTIGSSGNMWLIDDVMYSDANTRNADFDEKSEQSIMGLVSEGDIIIKDNVRNGKADMSGRGPTDNSNYDAANIVITAGMVALGQSFTFEHQNDDWEAYQGPTPDERGYIYLHGAVTQLRRGYVHRSNHGQGNGTGTGYGKSYHYDFRFDRRPPPFYLEALDENGHGLFDIISWGEQRPVR
jgi:hypothetical protein